MDKINEESLYVAKKKIPEGQRDIPAFNYASGNDEVLRSNKGSLKEAAELEKQHARAELKAEETAQKKTEKAQKVEKKEKKAAKKHHHHHHHQEEEDVQSRVQSLASVSSTSASSSKAEDPLCPEPTIADMNTAMEDFSRTFDKKFYDKAFTIYNAHKGEPNWNEPKVSTWELYDQSFAWPRVRKYDLVRAQMDILEHYEDNLNTNITNKVNLNRFIEHAQQVQRNLGEKYHNGEWTDPATGVSTA